LFPLVQQVPEQALGLEPALEQGMEPALELVLGLEPVPGPGLELGLEPEQRKQQPDYQLILPPLLVQLKFWYAFNPPNLLLLFNKRLN
jgi:hypothetical protein